MSLGGNCKVTLRKWYYLFWTTLVVGSIAGLAGGLLLQWTDHEVPLAGKAIGFSIITMLLGGATISVLSQMGFFAYLIARYLFKGFLRKRWVEDAVQVIMIVIVLFDLVYLRRTPDSGWAAFFILPMVMLAVAWGVAWWKVKLTNASARIPTLFFMIVVTAIEAVPSIRLNNPASTFYMMVPLLACNAWQILILSKVLQTDKEPL